MHKPILEAFNEFLETTGLLLSFLYRRIRGLPSTYPWITSAATITHLPRHCLGSYRAHLLPHNGSYYHQTGYEHRGTNNIYKLARPPRNEGQVPLLNQFLCLFDPFRTIWPHRWMVRINFFLASVLRPTPSRVSHFMTGYLDPNPCIEQGVFYRASEPPQTSQSTSESS